MCYTLIYTGFVVEFFVSLLRGFMQIKLDTCTSRRNRRHKSLRKIINALLSVGKIAVKEYLKYVVKGVLKDVDYFDYIELINEITLLI